MFNTLISRIKSPTDRTTQVLLFLILGIAVYLRLHRLTFQSLWLDELYTMRECDPAISWKETKDQVMSFEWKSPVYFFAIKLFFGVFGYTPYVARLVSVVGGVLGVWAMFVLGREILSKRLGLICAFFCAINYFHIYYSQEARGYSFFFLFTAWSLIYFLRFVKSPSVNHSAYLGLFSLLAVYMHPFGLIAVFCVLVLLLFFLFTRHRSEKRVFILNSSIAPTLVVLGLLPLYNMFAEANNQRSSWMEMPKWDFFIEYLQTFFYKSDFTWYAVLFLACLFIVSIFGATLNKGAPDGFSKTETGIMLSTWLVVLFTVPYLRCQISGVAVLHERYLINTLPAVLLLISFGVASLESKWIRTFLIVVFAGTTANDLFLLKRYYFVTTKAQFREMTRFISENNKNSLPIINESCGWQQQYYLNYFGMNNKMFAAHRKQVLDSIITSAAGGHAQSGFWIAGSHGEPLPERGFDAGLDADFIEAKRGFFPDAWAILYLPAKQIGNKAVEKNRLQLLYESTGVTDGDTVAIVSNDVIANCAKTNLKAGAYTLLLLAKSNDCGGGFLQLDVFDGEKKIGSCAASKHLQLLPPIKLRLTSDSIVNIRVKLSETQPCAGSGANLVFLKTVYLFAE